jgi:LPS-assembly protein
MLSLAIAGTVAFTALPAQAADTANAKKVEANVPITVEADELYFSDLTGDLFAKGKVVVTKGPDQVLGEVIRGNSKQNEVWADDNATFLQPGTRLVGSTTRYNFNSHSGTMLKAAGQVDREKVTGQNIEMLPEEIIINDGTITTCPAKVPDYHVSASKVEIWPGDKLIAYNAKFWIKDKVIYTLPKYQKSLQKDAQSEFPQLGYSSQDGFSLKQHFEYPLTNKIAAYGDLAYYTKAKFKPAYGIFDNEGSYKIDLTQGNYRDVDGNWIKKEPELNLHLFSRPVGKLPIDYSFTAIYGKWTDAYKTSWHQDYSLYFSGHPIPINKTTTLYLGTGMENIRESFNGSQQTILRYDATMGKSWSPKFYTWVGYHYTRNDLSLFEYGRNDLSKELDTGFSYQIDKMNTVVFSQTYDVTNNRIYDQDYTWRRNLHCWEANITYRAKRDQVVVDLSVARF